MYSGSTQIHNSARTQTPKNQRDTLSLNRANEGEGDRMYGLSDHEITLFLEAMHPDVPHSHVVSKFRREAPPLHGCVDGTYTAVLNRHRFKYLKAPLPKCIRSRLLDLGYEVKEPLNEVIDVLSRMQYNCLYLLKVSSVGIVTLVGPETNRILRERDGASFVQSLVELAETLNLRLQVGEIDGNTTLTLAVEYESTIPESVSQARLELISQARRFRRHCQELEGGVKDTPVELYVRDLACQTTVFRYRQQDALVYDLYEYFAGVLNPPMPVESVLDLFSFNVEGKRVTSYDKSTKLSDLCNPGAYASAQLLVVGGKKKKQPKTLAGAVGAIARTIKRATKSKTGRAVGSVARGIAEMSIGKNAARAAETALDFSVDSFAKMGRGHKIKVFRHLSMRNLQLKLSANSLAVLRAAVDPFNPSNALIYIGTGTSTMSKRTVCSTKQFASSNSAGTMIMGIAPCVANNSPCLFFTNGSAAVTTMTPYSNAATPVLASGWSTANLTTLPYTNNVLAASGAVVDTSISTDVPVGCVVLAAYRVTNVSAVTTLGGCVVHCVPQERDNMYGAGYGDLTSQVQVAPAVTSREVLMGVIAPSSDNENSFELGERLSAPNATGAIQTAHITYPMSGGTTIVPANTASSIGGIIAMIVSTQGNAFFEVEYIQYTEFIGQQCSSDYSSKMVDSADWTLCCEVLRAYQDLLQRSPLCDVRDAMRASIALVSKRHMKFDCSAVALSI